MNRTLLHKHLENFVARSKANPDRFAKDSKERQDLIRRYQAYTGERLSALDTEGLYEYLSPLWAMRMWSNKRYVVDKIVEDNGLDVVREQLTNLVWGSSDIAERWNGFRAGIKGIGPAMMSEVLCKTHPADFMLWNRRAYVALNYLEVNDLPRYDYQLTGKRYRRLCDVCKEIAGELDGARLDDTSLLAVDYFLWEELQVADNLANIGGQRTSTKKPIDVEDEATEFVHNDVRDKIRDIGQWLGFNAHTEQRVSEGSRVDAVWEAIIGNMGRVIYVFEVQTKGSIDSLILNLLKSLNNPAVQGVVAVSDQPQLEKIKSHAEDVRELRDKLKYWDYEEVLQVHESLEFVNSSINELGLVPQGF